MIHYLEDYTQTHNTAEKGRMSSEQCSKMFASLRQEDMQLFFREWMKHKKQKEYLAYDVTSISSYSKNIQELEWGYNRDKERLPQINMGMYYGEESGLPLYSSLSSLKGLCLLLLLRHRQYCFLLFHRQLTGSLNLPHYM